MRIPRRLGILAPRAAEVVTVGAGTSEAAVPQAPDTAKAEDPDPQKQPPEKWRDTKLGFLDAQLGDQDRMDRYNLHTTITTLRRCVYTALGFASAFAGSAAFVARVSGTAKQGVIVVLVALFV